MKELTNLYQLDKTLKFGLEPVGKTAETIRRWIEEMNSKESVVDNDANLFMKDKKIKDAYLAIKPIMDSLHEQFIEKSLKSESARKISFSDYFEAYKTKSISAQDEKELRKKIGDTYEFAGVYFSEEINKAIEELKKKGKKVKGVEKNEKKGVEDEKNKSKKDKKPYEILSDAKMYKYLLAKVEKLSKKGELENHIKQFKGFWGYLDEYNKNRKNYYIYEKEASTAVATRIVHENLPTFCNNILRFEKRKEEYLGIYQFLKDNNIETKIKDSKGEEIDVEAISENIFQIQYFNKCLAQSQIEEYNRIIGNYNMLINLYNQSRRGNKDFKKIDEFEKLYKQIGCGKKKSMFETLQSESDVKKLLEKACEAGKKMFKTNSCSHETVPDFMEFLKECDNWDGIYMSKTAISQISNLYFANWHSIKDRLKESKVDACITYDKNREEPIKLRDAVELSGLFAVLDSERPEFTFKESLFIDAETNDYRGVLDKKLRPSENLIRLLCFDIERNMKEFLDASDNIVALDKYRDENKQEGEEDQTITQITNWFDVATNAIRIVRYFAVRKSKMKGNLPNTTMEKALNNLLYCDDVQWFKWNDLMRNYLAKKPQDDKKKNKMKLNFGKGNLLAGWVDNKTKSDNGTQYGGYLFRKRNEINEYDYYLGISSDTHLFRENTKLPSDDRSGYERLDYYQFKGDTFYGGAYQGDYTKESRSIVDAIDNFIENNCTGKSKGIRRKKEITAINYLNLVKEQDVTLYEELLNDERFQVANNNIIQSLKSTLISLSRIEKAKELSKKEYRVFSEIQNDVETLGNEKVFAYFPVSEKEFDSVMDREEKPLYLFKISNKDLSFAETFAKDKRKSRGVDNLHTMYFKSLMEGDQSVFDIGTGEVFIREKAFEYDDNVWKYGHHYNELKDKFNYPIISNKRFAENKLQLHLSIKQNYNPRVKPGQNGYQQKQINEIDGKITDSIQISENLQFIGVDRGEKHLVYSCTIDKDGKIIKCNHHDNINGTDYVQKLGAVADERIIAKKNLQQQCKIKDLKSGYISHVVHSLVEEVIKDNGKIAPHAYVVLEDLSVGMKRSRQKFEKQVYQNLETALAKKLNFVVDKNAKKGELGSVSQALQLTPPLKNYDDIKGKKQFGIMLYTRANYTSVTDPAAGWRKTIYIKNGKEDDIKNQILEKFDDFGFDGKDYYFEYTEANAGYKWCLYSGKNGESLPRYQNKKQMLQDKNVWVPEKINIVNLLNVLFANFDKTTSFKKQIVDGVELRKIEGRSETAWQSLRYVLDMIQQIRNSGEKNSKDDNILYSPVRNKNGEHFDTRNYKNNGELSEIRDADANGAYNIARKGLIMDAHIKYWIEQGRPMKSDKKGGKTSDLDLFISDEEWDLWLLNRELWEKKLPFFASRNAKEGMSKSSIAKKGKKKR